MTLHKCFVYPPPIPNIESLSQSTISLLDSGSFDRNRADGNIQQPTTLEVANKETVMDYNEDIDPPPPHDISDVFATADLSSQSSFASVRYKLAWHRAKGICSSILYSGESPDTCSRAFSIALNHKEIASILVMTSAVLPKKKPMQLPDTNKRKKIVLCNSCWK